MDRSVKLVLLFSITFFVMLLLDYIWLRIISELVFNSLLNNIGGFRNGAFEIRNLYSTLVYFFIGLSIIYVFDLNILDEQRAVFLGFFIGLLLYSSISLSNFFFYNNFPPLVVAIDIIWGCFLFSTASYTIYKFADKFFEVKE